MKKVVLIFSLLSCVACIGQGINIYDEFLAINERYANLKQMSVDIEMSYQDNEGTIIQIQRGKVVYADEFYYSKIAGQITMLDKKNYLSVNKNNRLITVSNYSWDSAVEPSKKGISEQLDSLWKLKDNLTYSVVSVTQNTVRIAVEDSSNPFYSSYELLIDIKDKKLLEYVYHSRKLENGDGISTIRIKYLNESTKPKLSNKEFKLNFYVSKNRDKYSVTDQFNNYQLIDQTKY